VTDILSVSVDQMREVDRLMTEGVGISLLQMMENAGRAAARRLAVWGAAVTVVLAQSLEEMHRRLGLTVGPIFAESDIIPIDPT